MVCANVPLALLFVFRDKNMFTVDNVDRFLSFFYSDGSNFQHTKMVQ